MNKRFVEILKGKFREIFTHCEFKINEYELVINNVQLPIVPEEVNKTIAEAAIPFKLRKGHIGWSQHGSSIIILFNP